MKNQIFKLVILLAVVAIGIANCKKDDESAPNTTPDETPQPLLDVFDQLTPADAVQPEAIKLPNGWTLKDFMEENDSAFYHDLYRNGAYDDLTPSQAYAKMLGRMAAKAMHLTDRTNFQYPKNSPALDGLAYSWGSKDHEKLQPPPGKGAICTHTIYGLDCSGFIFQMFKAAGVSFPDGNADLQRQKTTLEANIAQSIPALKNIKFEELQQPTPTTFRTGDLVFWRDSSGNVFHIGAVLETSSGQKILFHSIGRNSSEAGQCDQNLGKKRGPVRHFLGNNATLPLQKYTYSVMRATVEGDCTGCANNFCDQPPTETLIRQSLADFKFAAGKATKAESKLILKHLCADIVHEITYPDGGSFVCGKLPSGYEITLWQPTYNQTDRYGVRFGLLSANHAYFGSNATYFEVLK